MAAIDGKWLSKEGLTYFWSKIKSIFTKQTETNVIANLGAKNLLNNQFLYTESGTGVTITSNGDGTYSLSGTATGTATYLYTPSSNRTSKYGLESSGSYIITSGSDKILIRVDYSTNGSSWESTPLVNDTPEGAVFTIPDNTVGLYIRFRSTASAGSLNGVVLKPMIRPAEITDDTFQPYAKTNRELTVAEDEDRAALIGQVDGGAKNILNLNTNLTSYTSKGITYTNNGDGTINVSGTSNAWDSYVTLYDVNGDTLFGIPKGETVTLKSTSNNVSVNLIYKKQGGGYGLTVRGYKDSPATFTIPSDFSGYLLRIAVPNTGTTVEEDVGAMICTAADYTVSPAFVPYAPTNRELYETRFASKTILPNNVDLNNIKTGGIYNGVNSTGNSAVHMPVATGSFNFVLTVIEANEFIIQIFKQLNSAGDPNFYVRRFYIYNSDWDSWYQFTGTQV